ncbi:MAG TPA: polymer-forming cytoskeletal protein [Polyangiaceae bacterium]|jgi:cytoskeletal protein CcmA (bactofilin family)|nr:polymer-forming cytoskeletal protein [Polyangiaceae bacterium]
MATVGMTATVIGRSARIVGRIAGDGDVEVEGFVEGDIAVTGDVTVAAEGLVGAAVKGRHLVVRGAVKGDLTGDVSVAIEAGARVVGDVRAPRVTIAEGALVRGFVQTSDDELRTEPSRGAHRALPARADARGRSQDAASRPAPPSPPSRASLPKPESAPSAAATPAASQAGAKRSPPPPVVPALKKLRGQVVRKRER